MSAIVGVLLLTVGLALSGLGRSAPSQAPDRDPA
jgi:hypothetical protein